MEDETRHEIRGDRMTRAIAADMRDHDKTQVSDELRLLGLDVRLKGAYSLDDPDYQLIPFDP